MELLILWYWWTFQLLPQGITTYSEKKEAEGEVANSHIFNWIFVLPFWQGSYISLSWLNECPWRLVCVGCTWKIQLWMLLFNHTALPTLCNPVACSMPDFPVLYHLLESAQIHVHWVDDAIQPSHPLLTPSPPTLNLSHHQGLFQWAGSLHQVAKVLEL